MIMTASHFIKTCLPLLCALSAYGQDAIEQVETSRQSADAVRASAQGAAIQSAAQPGKKLSQSTEDSEFGQMVVIQERASFDPWRARLSVQGFHTDNAALAPVQVKDYFMHYRAELAYVNRLNSTWNFEAQLSQDFLRYDRFSSLDFDITGARAGLATKLAWLGDATFSLSYDLHHLTEAGFGDRITTSHAMTATLFQSWNLGHGQKLLAGILSQPEFHTEPAFAQRHDHGVYAVWSAQLAEKLTARLLGRASYRVRPHADRDDWNFVTRASLSYELAQSLIVTASSGVTWNLSSKDRFDYRNHLTGAFLSFDYRF
jgi:hypothetical protein